MAITSFRGEHSFLSNFSDCKMVYEGIEYPTSEHAYQAAKVTSNEERQKIVSMTPGEVKKWGRNVVLRDNFENIKLQIMEDILRIKFSQAKLKEKLLATGSEELVEGNWWHDKFWGQCPVGTGENHLGKLLMKIREELQNI